MKDNQVFGFSQFSKFFRLQHKLIFTQEYNILTQKIYPQRLVEEHYWISLPFAVEKS